MYWVSEGSGLVSLPDTYAAEFAKRHPEANVFEADLAPIFDEPTISSKKTYLVAFEFDLSSDEGRQEAERLVGWMAKERYDCPDTNAARRLLRHSGRDLHGTLLREGVRRWISKHGFG